MIDSDKLMFVESAGGADECKAISTVKNNPSQPQKTKQKRQTDWSDRARVNGRQEKTKRKKLG